MEYGKLKVIHCEFEKDGLNKIQSSDFPIFYYDLNSEAGVSPCTDKKEEYGVRITYKYRVFLEKEHKGFIGSYVSEQWFYIKFPNDNDVELMREIKWLCDHSQIWTIDKFNELKTERQYPFTPWTHTSMSFDEVENILSLLRQAHAER